MTDMLSMTSKFDTQRGKQQLVYDLGFVKEWASCQGNVLLEGGQVDLTELSLHLQTLQSQFAVSHSPVRTLRSGLCRRDLMQTVVDIQTHLGNLPGDHKDRTDPLLRTSLRRLNCFFKEGWHYQCT